MTKIVLLLKRENYLCGKSFCKNSTYVVLITLYATYRACIIPVNKPIQSIEKLVGVHNLK